MRNLQAEMSRRGVRSTDICRLLGLSEKTVFNKLNEHTAFKYPEAQAIRDTYFPGMDLEYLFAPESASTAQRPPAPAAQPPAPVQRDIPDHPEAIPAVQRDTPAAEEHGEQGPITILTPAMESSWTTQDIRDPAPVVPPELPPDDYEGDVNAGADEEVAPDTAEFCAAGGYNPMGASTGCSRYKPLFKNGRNRCADCANSFPEVG